MSRRITRYCIQQRKMERRPSMRRYILDLCHLIRLVCVNTSFLPTLDCSLKILLKCQAVVYVVTWYMYIVTWYMYIVTWYMYVVTWYMYKHVVSRQVLFSHLHVRLWIIEICWLTDTPNEFLHGLGLFLHSFLEIIGWERWYKRQWRIISIDRWDYAVCNHNVASCMCSNRSRQWIYHYQEIWASKCYMCCTCVDVTVKSMEHIEVFFV